MIVSFLTNGMSPFGLKMLTEMHLADRYQYQYLIFWYLSASLLPTGVFVAKHSRPYRREVLTAACMALCSVLGQLGMVAALGHNVPGYIVYPIATGGSLFFVVAGGVILFKEKLGRYGVAGIVLGIASVVILALP